MILSEMAISLEASEKKKKTGDDQTDQTLDPATSEDRTHGTKDLVVEVHVGIWLGQHTPGEP